MTDEQESQQDDRYGMRHPEYGDDDTYEITDDYD